MSMTRPNDKMGSLVAWPSGQTGCGQTHSSWLKHRDAARVTSWSVTRLAIARSIACTGQLPSNRPRPVQFDEETVTRLGPDPISSSWRIVLVSSWSIFSLTKENWKERLSQCHSPAQTLTYMWTSFFAQSSPLSRVFKLNHQADVLSGLLWLETRHYLGSCASMIFLFQAFGFTWQGIWGEVQQLHACLSVLELLSWSLFDRVRLFISDASNWGRSLQKVNHKRL